MGVPGRSVAVYLVCIWILVACFAIARPLLVKQHPLTRNLSAGQLGVLMIAVFIPISLEAILLVRHIRIAVLAASVICVEWTFLIVLRIMLALQHSPAIFGDAAARQSSYVPAVFAIVLNGLVMWYLVSRMRKQ